MKFSFFDSEQYSSITGTATITEDNVFLVDPTDDNGNWVGLRYGDLAYFCNYHLTEMYRRYRHEYRMYKGKHDILYQPKKDSWKPDNRIVMNYPKKLVDSFSGYFVGKAPTMNIATTDGTDEDTVSALDEQLNTFNSLNNTSRQIKDLAKWVDIFGRAYTLIFQDTDKTTKYRAFKPQDGFVIYSDDIQRRPLFGVYYENTNSKQEIVADVYGFDSQGQNATAMGITISQSNDYNTPVELATDKLSFGMLPMIEWMSNSERMALLEGQDTVVNAIDSAISNKKNDTDYFADSLLWAKNIKVSKDPEVLKNLKDKHIFETMTASGNDDSQLSFLNKPDADVKEENLINRLVFSLYDISGIVDLNDKDFTNASSGEALKQRLQAMRQMADDKADYFTQSLTQLFACFLTIHLNADFIPNIDIKFNINDPLDLVDMSTTLVNFTKAIASGVISRETALTQLGIDAGKETNRIEREQSETNGTMPTFATDQEASQAQDNQTQQNSEQNQDSDQTQQDS